MPRLFITNTPLLASSVQLISSMSVAIISITYPDNISITLIAAASAITFLRHYAITPPRQY